MIARDSTVKAAIHTASAKLHSTVDATETAANAAAERVDAAMGTARKTFDNVQTAGLGVAEAIGSFGRTGWNGLKEVNGAVVSHSSAAVADLVAVGQKTFAVKSMQELVALHADYTTRRINAGFQAVSEINAIAHSNVIALWQPIVGAMVDAGTAANEATVKKAARTAKSAAKA